MSMDFSLAVRAMQAVATFSPDSPASQLSDTIDELQAALTTLKGTLQPLKEDR